ncbi:hypothetical protein ACHAWF_017217 [Thalassiosira exigua]
MITTNDEQNNERRAQRRRTISPLPYVAPPPTPRPSFSRRLQRSSFLFPKTHSSPRMTNNSTWRRITSDERHEPTQMNVRPVQLDTNRSNDGNGDNDSEKRTGGLDLNHDEARTNESKKKKVRFRDEPTTAHCVDTPRASNLSVGEKRSMWYDEADFDAFKRDAARAAGVRIVRCRESKYHGKDADDSKGRFALLGNFDDKCDIGGPERSGAAAAKDDRPDAKTAVPPATAASTAAAEGKRYYNQNEYGDRRVPASDFEGGTLGSTSGSALGSSTLVCKRGLGYHFSRARKRSRFLARSAVLAWQEALRDRAREEAREGRKGRASASSSGGGSNPKPEPKASSPKERAEALGNPNGDPTGDPRRDKSRVVLALVSSKCSRIAREEARWRGDVDYRVAHPERRGRVGVGPARGKAKRRNGRSAGVSTDLRGRKRRKADASARAGGGGGGASRDDDGKREERLSPATIGYFVDVVLSA